KGLIYSGEYIINWDPATKTALSDIEVIYEEVNGHFYHMRYPIKDSDDTIEIATTRPETMLGDTAVAVHPDDERYQQVVGRKVIRPTSGRESPSMAGRYVDVELGCGGVEITPAGEPADFDVGGRHDLDHILVMHEDGTMNAGAAKYVG